MNTRILFSRLLVFLFVGGLVLGCQDPLQEDLEIAQEEDTPVNVDPTWKSKGENARGGGGVMMQAFYWDVPAGGTWWDVVEGKVDSWANAGITSMWLPPVNKAQGGGYSMGYDPMDYWDFGDYNQMGTVETRFGSKTELQGLISKAHSRGVDVIADIVINHNSGGDSEYNPYTGGNTWTDYNPASGKFFRNYGDFHPNDIQNNDEGAFGGFPDLCHSKGYVSGWLWANSNSMSKYYKNTMGFDGFRFDFVKGFGPWVAKEFRNSVGSSTFGVGELWDSNRGTLNWWANAADMSVFDFALYYSMDNAFDGNDLRALDCGGYVCDNSWKAVTFVANHDTDIIYNNKLLAYAYILFNEGYPCIFYRDYEDWLDKNKLNNLIWCRQNLAGGGTNQHYLDQDEYVVERYGYYTSGAIMYMGINGNKTRWVGTKWPNTLLHDYTGNQPDVWTNNSGWAPLKVNNNSYSIYAPAGQ